MLLRATAFAMLVSGTAAFAAEPQVYRLSPDEIEAAKTAGALRAESPALLPSPHREAVLGNSLYPAPESEDAVKRKIHGEAGFFVGTGGTRGFFGSAAIPLGQNSSLSLSFQNSQGYGNGYGGYGGGYGYGNNFGGFGSGFPGYPYRSYRRPY
jgi:hypothetical protein